MHKKLEKVVSNKNEEMVLRFLTDTTQLPADVKLLMQDFPTGANREYLVRSRAVCASGEEVSVQSEVPLEAVSRMSRVPRPEIKAQMMAAIANNEVAKVGALCAASGSVAEHLNALQAMRITVSGKADEFLGKAVCANADEHVIRFETSAEAPELGDLAAAIGRQCAKSAPQR